MLCCFLQGNLQFVDDEKDQAESVPFPFVVAKTRITLAGR